MKNSNKKGKIWKWLVPTIAVLTLGITLPVTITLCSSTKNNKDPNISKIDLKANLDVIKTEIEKVKKLTDSNQKNEVEIQIKDSLNKSEKFKSSIKNINIDLIDKPQNEKQIANVNIEFESNGFSITNYDALENGYSFDSSKNKLTISNVVTNIQGTLNAEIDLKANLNVIKNEITKVNNLSDATQKDSVATQIKESLNNSDKFKSSIKNISIALTDKPNNEKQIATITIEFQTNGFTITNYNDLESGYSFNNSNKQLTISNINTNIQGTQNIQIDLKANLELIKEEIKKVQSLSDTNQKDNIANQIKDLLNKPEKLKSSIKNLTIELIDNPKNEKQEAIINIEFESNGFTITNYEQLDSGYTFNNSNNKLTISNIYTSIQGTIDTNLNLTMDLENQIYSSINKTIDDNNFSLSDFLNNKSKIQQALFESLSKISNLNRLINLVDIFSTTSGINPKEVNVQINFKNGITVNIDNFQTTKFQLTVSGNNYQITTKNPITLK